MKIGLVPMSAKPFHRGHEDLIRLADKENELTLVFVGFGARGIKKRKKQKRKFEEPINDQFPIYSDTMQKVWQGYSTNDIEYSGMKNLIKKFKNVRFIFPGDEIDGEVANASPLQSVLRIFLSLITEKSNYGTLDKIDLPFLGRVDVPDIRVYSDPEDTQTRYSTNALITLVRSSILKVGTRELKNMSPNKVASINNQSLMLVNSVLNLSPGFTPRSVTRGEGTTNISGTRVRQLLQLLRQNITMAEDEYNSVLDEIESYLPEMAEGEAKRIVSFLVSVAKERDRLGGIFPDELNEFNRTSIRQFLFELKTPDDDLMLGTDSYANLVEEIMTNLKRIKKTLRARTKNGKYFRKEASKIQGALESLRYLRKKSEKARLLNDEALNEDFNRSEIKNFLAKLS